MYRSRIRTGLLTVTVVGLVMAGGAAAQWALGEGLPTVPVQPPQLAKAVESIEDLDQMRQGLAASLEGQTTQPTADTFKQVCVPVGKQAMKLGADNGWKVKQIAEKFRNPAHAPDGPKAQEALERFTTDRQLVGFWIRDTVESQPGARYFRRIDMKASCLACHGAKNSRPEFIKQKYPNDRAYDFQVGDLRGMYSVFIPDAKLSSR
jgi:hypothetical protein